MKRIHRTFVSVELLMVTASLSYQLDGQKLASAFCFGLCVFVALVWTLPDWDREGDGE